MRRHPPPTSLMVKRRVACLAAGPAPPDLHPQPFLRGTKGIQMPQHCGRRTSALSRPMAG
eukprot:scaffold1309_cov117-Isochrysis_galbana.AAC.13